MTAFISSGWPVGRSMFLRVWFVVFLLVAHVAMASSIIAGKGGRGPPPSPALGLSDQTEYVNLGEIGAAVAFGDFNGDRFIDLLVVDKYRKKLQVAFWNHDQYQFSLHSDSVTVPKGEVTGAAAADFNNDGLLDIVVSTSENKGHIYLNNFNQTGSFQPHTTLEDFSAGFLVLDANNNLLPDIFLSSESGSRGFYVNSPPGTFTYTPWRGFNEDCIIKEPNSNAFVDMDGDCSPDLVLTTSCGLEVWSNPAGAQRTLWNMTASDSSLLYKSPRGMWTAALEGRLTFADFNGDGAMDILFPDSQNREVVLLLNKQVPKRFGSLCDRDPNWSLVRKTAVRDIAFLQTNHGTVMTVPPTLRAGDFNLDGWNDFVGLNAETKVLEVYRNVYNKQNSGNVFEMYSQDRALLGMEDIIAATFFDVDDSGRQDILTVHSDGSTRLVWNNNKEDADFLFFKGTGMNGLSYFSEPRPFAPTPGNTFTITYDGGNGPEFRTCSQCPQSAYMSLQRCNCFFGLRRIVNYISEMAMGTSGLSRSWQGLMPNSMALLWPTDSGSASTKGWWMEYFTQRRGGQMLGIVIVLSVCLVLLAVVILYLSWRERIEDRKEKQQNSELFGFAST